MAKDVIVVVKRDALPTTKESLDILLISTTGAQPVGVYRDVESVKAVYGDDGKTPNSKIVRKATTLMNQGKTTLAETLVNKFKIVGFEPPTASPAVAATFVINFDNDVFPFDAPAAGQKLYVRIGGDDNAVVTLTAKVEVADGTKLAAQFKGATFNKGGMTYTATVKGTVVTFTATEGGSTDSIPERIEIFLDEALSQEFVATGRKTFTNGKDAMTAADSLIETIKEFQRDEDNDWYYFMTDRDEPEFVKALAKFAEASEPSEAELGAGVEDHRKFYMGQTSDIDFADNTARAAVIYTDEKHLDEEPDASYTGNVGPFYPKNVTWKFKRPQDGNAAASEGAKLITLPKLTEGQRNQLSENHVNYLTEEYKRQYVKEGVCLNGEFIDVVLGGDWIAKRMRDLLYDILLDNANVDYTDSGFALVSTAVSQALSEAADPDHNIIARDQESKAGIFTVVIPKYADSTDEQRRNRIMPDITWEALLSGAIHKVKTKGVLRVSL